MFKGYKRRAICWVFFLLQNVILLPSPCASASFFLSFESSAPSPPSFDTFDSGSSSHLFPFLPFFFPLSFPSSPKTLRCCHWSWVEQENLEATEPCCSYSQLRTWQKEGEARSAPNSSFLVTFAAVTLRGRHHRSSASKQSSSPSTPPGVLSGSCTDQRKIAASSPSPLQHFSSVGSEELACRSCILTSSPAKLELHSSSLLLR